MTSINNVGVAEWLRQQSAKLFYVGSNPITSTTSGGCVLDRSEDTQRTRLRRYEWEANGDNITWRRKRSGDG